MQPFYNLDFDIYPFRKNHSEIFEKLNFAGKPYLKFDLDLLSPKLLHFFAMRKMGPLNCFLYDYNLEDVAYGIQTPGDFDSDKKRRSTLEWNLISGSMVRFYDPKIGSYEFVENGNYTKWEFESGNTGIGDWDTVGTAIVNPQIPQQVLRTRKSKVRFRKTIVINFKESYDMLYSVLNDKVSYVPPKTSE
jgi:hypothetical protein